MSKTHKKTLWFIAVMVALFFLLGSAMFLLYRQVVLASAVVKEAEKEIAILDYKERNLDDNKKNIEVLGASFAAIEGSFVSRSSFVQFVELIEKIAGDANVSFVAQGATLPISLKDKANLRFEVRGTYASITQFLILFDLLPYAGLLEDIRVVPLGNGSNNLRATMTYTIYSFVPTP